MAQPSTEPSMEDILASIKRIIAEDGEAAPQSRGAARTRRGVAAAAPVAEDRDEPGNQIEPVRTTVAFAMPVREDRPPAPAPAPVTETPVEAAVPDPAPPADTGPDPQPDAFEEPADVLELTSPLPDERQPILSGAAADASRNAFAALGQLQVRPEAAGQTGTLEGLVADLLKPMLRDWLDRELPALVERLVAAEIQRVSGRG